MAKYIVTITKATIKRRRRVACKKSKPKKKRMTSKGGHSSLAEDIAGVSLQAFDDFAGKK